MVRRLRPELTRNATQGIIQQCAWKDDRFDGAGRIVGLGDTYLTLAAQGNGRSGNGARLRLGHEDAIVDGVSGGKLKRGEIVDRSGKATNRMRRDGQHHQDVRMPGLETANHEPCPRCSSAAGSF